MLIQSKLPLVGTTIFTKMSALAVEYKAINLGQGFPDFGMNEQLIELVYKAMKDGHNQYAHSNGLTLLREVISQKVKKLYNTTIDNNDEITITPGATYAIYTALTTLLNPSDEVIVFEPAYDSYIPNIEINGAKPIVIKLQYPAYDIPWEVVMKSITANTKLIMINSPHNPTGMVLNNNDIEHLHKIVEKYPKILLLSDEVYEHLIFDDLPHLSILKYPALFEKAFVTFSFGKTYHCTGWKMGYCIAPKNLMSEFRKVHQFNCFTTNSFTQVALAEYMLNERVYLELGKEMQLKRDYFRALMQGTNFIHLESHGSYFECYSYGHFSDESDVQMAVNLVEKYGVATIPTSAFYSDKTDNKVLRFCFAKKDETLEKAVECLKKL